MNGRLVDNLTDKLSSDQIHQLLENTSVLVTLPEKLQAVVESVFAESYTLQFQVMIAFAAVQIPASLLMFRRGQQYVVA